MNISEWRTHAERVLAHLRMWQTEGSNDPSPIYSWFRNSQGPNAPRGYIKRMKIEGGEVWFQSENSKRGTFSEWSRMGTIERTRSIFQRLLDASLEECASVRPNAPAINLNQPEMRCNSCGALGPWMCGGCRAEQRGEF